MPTYLLVILIGYLFGCLQWSYILGLLVEKQDIRNLGKGNAGASNAVISFGWKMGLAVGLLDILKAVFSVLLVKYLIANRMDYLYLNGASVILGHNYPFFMNFKGGKGTASNVGMIFAINYKLGLIAFVLVLTATLTTGYVVVGTMILVSFFFLATIYMKYGLLPSLISLAIGLLSAYKHRENFTRIKNGEEVKLSSLLNKKKK